MIVEGVFLQDTVNDNLIVFGPVPSRRLGRSLGVNNIPPKICSYSCVYCQLGRTVKFMSAPEKFYGPDAIYIRVKEKTDKIIQMNEKLDYITFVPDGEPTLDADLSAEIEKIKKLGFKTAVITNSSLICNPSVAQALSKADLVCLKVDAVSENIWIKINRPAKNIKLKPVLEAIIEFSSSYKGILITDTMLVEGINDGVVHLQALADYLLKVNASKNYISVITRPPAENLVKRPSEEIINMAYQLINDSTGKAEYNISYEGDDFCFMGEAEKDFLSIISVHPMRVGAVKEFLERAGLDWSFVQELKTRGKIVETVYDGVNFYTRKLS
jgi:wyosine [tRNA(Phe)-imidazoG37] synthetase (radical SAM superfamily)